MRSCIAGMIPSVSAEFIGRTTRVHGKKAGTARISINFTDPAGSGLERAMAARGHGPSGSSSARLVECACPSDPPSWGSVSLEGDGDAVGQVRRDVRICVSVPGLEVPGLAGRGGDESGRGGERAQIEGQGERAGAPRELNLTGAYEPSDGAAKAESPLGGGDREGEPLVLGGQEEPEGVDRDRGGRDREVVCGERGAPEGVDDCGAPRRVRHRG